MLAGEFLLTIDSVARLGNFLEVLEQVGRLGDGFCGEAGELKILDNGFFLRVLGEHHLTRSRGV